MRAHVVLLLGGVVAVACGGRALSSSADGGNGASEGGAGDDSASMASSGAVDDGAALEGGDEQAGDAGSARDAADSAPDVFKCMQPVIYGGSSGSGMNAIGWQEVCGNGHTYQAYCQYPYCECDCTDEGPDGDVFGRVLKCGGYGFGACGYPCVPDSGDCDPSISPHDQ